MRPLLARTLTRPQMGWDVCLHARSQPVQKLIIYASWLCDRAGVYAARFSGGVCILHDGICVLAHICCVVMCASVRALRNGIPYGKRAAQRATDAAGHRSFPVSEA